MPLLPAVPVPLERPWDPEEQAPANRANAARPGTRNVRRKLIIMSTCRRMARIVIKALLQEIVVALQRNWGALDRIVRRGRSAGVVARNDSQGSLPEIVLKNGKLAQIGRPAHGKNCS